ncbi:MAG: filamentous hemagglutinin, partial [Cyanobacteria bacterium P01_E01_bin.35]
AETGDTANIDLQITNEIILQNNSFISAQAFNNANGGNLTIDTNFIVAYPNGDNNIVASAEQGNGGNIDITAKSLFGIEERPNNPSTNDINASSEFGLDGVVEINTLGLEPTQGLTKLPSAFVVSQPLQGCQANRDTDNSSFINTGRGGLPPNPYESLDNSKVFDDVQLPNRWTENSVVNAPSSPAPTESVVEATTWVVNNSGKVELVADTSSTIYQCGDQVSGN